MSATKTASIITFWLGPALQSLGLALARKEWWYRGGPAVDEEIRARFGPEVDLACNGGLAEWEGTPEGAFGLILLLDQFTRNLFRGTPDAWRGDPRAFRVVNGAIAAGLDRALHPVERIWLYHPFHHSESPTEQDRGLGLRNAGHARKPKAHPPDPRGGGRGVHRGRGGRAGRPPLAGVSTQTDRHILCGRPPMCATYCVV